MAFKINNVQMATKPLFELLDHCCRVCGGRLLQGAGVGRGSTQVRCAECGQSGEAAPGANKPWHLLCFCGVKLASGADAGLRCKRVEAPTPERPNEVVVQHVPAASAPVRIIPRPVRFGSD